jgi:hypothetical protein
MEGIEQTVTIPAVLPLNPVERRDPMAARPQAFSPGETSLSTADDLGSGELGADLFVHDRPGRSLM